MKLPLLNVPTFRSSALQIIISSNDREVHRIEVTSDVRVRLPGRKFEVDVWHACDHCENYKVVRKGPLQYHTCNSGLTSIMLRYLPPSLGAQSTLD